MNRTHFVFRSLFLLAGAAAGTSGIAQEVLLQEGFNNDGSAANPPRYTFTGRAVYEVPQIQAPAPEGLGNFDQKGPIYWDHNFSVSYAGNPEIPGRRAIVAWRGVDASSATPDLLAVLDATVDWLLNGKRNAQIVVNPNVASIQGLADHLAAAGHTLTDDDTATYPNEQDVAGDLFIHGPGANNPSRFVLVTKPVMVMNAPDYDDMLVGSIGTAVTFSPGQVTIKTPGHPAAGGKTGSFDALTGDHPFELIGSFLPTNTITIAEITRIVPPAVNNLADVEAMIAGTKTHEKTTVQLDAIDFADASTGDWADWDNGIPGGYTGNWGLQLKGRLSVATAGTYRIAVGSDDGARLQIDRDRNGFSANDTVLDDPGPHAHQIVYANVEFTAAGTYDFQVLSYNSAGGGDLEVSVAIQAGEIPDDNLQSGYWEYLGTASPQSPVRLSGQVEATGYRATGPDVQRQEPLIVLLNAPTDTPPGKFYDGGQFSGHEGAGFIGGSGLNKWAYPDGQTYRTVRLRPVNVAGKQNVHLTIALAATVVDFEDSDLLDVVIYPNGENSTPITLAHFRGVQNAVQPWLGDQLQNFSRRLTRQFADFTYDIPATATELIVEIRAATSWWTEIVAFDNVRITAGAAATPPTLGAATITGGEIKLAWTGGRPPYVVQRSTAIPGGWADVLTTTTPNASIPVSGATGFFRIQGSN